MSAEFDAQAASSRILGLWYRQEFGDARKINLFGLHAGITVEIRGMLEAHQHQLAAALGADGKNIIPLVQPAEDPRQMRLPC